ncbi:protein phosphatase 1 regulatory subunit 3A-like isoform X2 [Dunckerocampus dactyliophorus]|uniref:protein phosphatase 1 regulatory subunit 3A-like isoform X2 n=1 Tax=Dunckerocampus dactyliophorus TaxID=161453 RepID=UPI002405158E|nr:protein phosphatase 1 regulatory subunit 3A-like isoform X2 [Dunckerocampus dactyliophorus]
MHSHQHTSSLSPAEMSFLSIPSQEGLFIPIRRGRSKEDDDDDEEEDDDDDDEGDVRLIPRCSPVPRKRGASIHDETAEYLRIQAALSPGKRVSFADTTGGDLVDVREFVAFDSDDEEDSARWEEERAKYGKCEREPVFHVHPDFEPPSGEALLQDVSAHKVAIEEISPVEDEPLAFCGLVRVLNISFHKAVYIRSTMDNWATYFDHPAGYVHGSHDGDTDKFSFKLSFAPPYVTHGSRMEFVVRYETTEGDFWANNAHMNYVVTLLLAYEDETEGTNSEVQEIRGILRPPREYSICNYSDSSHKWKSEDTSPCGCPEVTSPVVMRPEVDVEARRMLEEMDRKQQLL